MKRLVFFVLLVLPRYASASTEIERLGPVFGPSSIPSQCRIAGILKESPAEKAGLVLGDIIESINGQTPKDASALAELIRAAPKESVLAIVKMDGTKQRLQIHLNAARPRLGAVCDLTGWAKPGVTSAGNESITVFSGPYALTASGIIDKGIVFLRVRVANDGGHPLTIGPDLFSAADGKGSRMALLSPKDVMCMLYGDKGAHLLALKKKRKDTLDTHESISGMDAAEEQCGAASGQGRLHNAESQYAEANAEYLATESLWPTAYKPGEAADGLVYLEGTAALPVTLNAAIEGRTLSASLGLPQPNEKPMKHSELVQFFEAQKKGDSLRLTLRKGKVFVGKFTSYDSVDERVWFVAPSGGMLNTISFSVESIRAAEPLELVPAAPAATSEPLN